jgi:hypothetical protein
MNQRQPCRHGAPASLEGRTITHHRLLDALNNCCPFPSFQRLFLFSVLVEFLKVHLVTVSELLHGLLDESGRLAKEASATMDPPIETLKGYRETRTTYMYQFKSAGLILLTSLAIGCVRTCHAWWSNSVQMCMWRRLATCFNQNLDISETSVRA